VLRAGDGAAPAADLRVRLPPDPASAARLRGRLLGPDGRPPSRLSARVVERAAERSWVADYDPSSGRFASRDLPAGRHELGVSSPEAAAATFGPFILAPGEARDIGDLLLERGGRLRVRVSDAWAAVTCRAARDGHRATLDPGETERLSEMLPPGEWVVRAESWSSVPQEVRVRVSAGEVTDVELALDPGIEQVIVLRPVAAGLRDAPDTRLVLRDAQGAVAWDSRRDPRPPVLHGEAGREPEILWEVRLRPGQYRMEVEGEGHRWEVYGLQPDANVPWILDGS
jgi:hypothetical protein